MRIVTSSSRSWIPLLIHVRHKSTNHWASLKKIKMPHDLAMHHFDNFYGKVYEELWPSVRVALLTQHKYTAVVNTFCDPENTQNELEELGCIDLGRYYNRHYKKMRRFQLRTTMLREKKAKKIAHLAAERGVDPGSIDPDTVTVSDISDSEVRTAGNFSSSGSEAEDLVEMFQTEIEKETPTFVNQASKNLNLHDYVLPTELKYKEDVYEGDKGYYNFYQAEVDVPVEFVQEDLIQFPESLKVYTFSRRSLESFPNPKVQDKIGVFNYYCMDGASILPPLVLGIKPRDEVADFCAAPGGKTLAMAMTLLPSTLLCNDLTIARFSRLQNVLKTYIPKMSVTNQMIHMRMGDARELKGHFDKILLDVPCTNDRTSATSDENNWFKHSRVKERVELPQVQCNLLVNGFRCLKPGGSLVYSTCSLSPIQNDGVVHMALKKLREESDIRVAVVDLKEAIRPLRGLFRFHRNMKYGQQVLPYLPSNFGPSYFCKFVRKE